MKQMGLIAGAVALVAALFFLNTGIGKNAHSDDDDDDQSASQTQTTSKQAPATPPGGSSQALTPEQTIGNPATAKYKITVGWVYDGANQANPTALNQSLDAVRQFAAAHKDAAVEIANVDVPAGARSPSARAVAGTGIAVNGKPLPGLNGNPGEGSETPGQIAGALSATVH